MPAARMSCPSAENASAQTGPRSAAREVPEHRPGPAVDDLDEALAVADREPVALGIEGHGQDRPALEGEVGDLAGALQVENAGRAVYPAIGEPAGLLVERQRVDAEASFQHVPRLDAARHVPDADRPVRRARIEPRAVGGEHDIVDARAMAFQEPRRGARYRPEADAPVPACGGHEAPVRRERERHHLRPVAAEALGNAALQVPEPDMVVVAGRHRRRGVDEAHRVHRRIMRLQPDRRARLPETHGIVEARGEQAASVRRDIDAPHRAAMAGQLEEIPGKGARRGQQQQQDRQKRPETHGQPPGVIPPPAAPHGRDGPARPSPPRTRSNGAPSPHCRSTSPDSMASNAPSIPIEPR